MRILNNSKNPKRGICNNPLVYYCSGNYNGKSHAPLTDNIAVYPNTRLLKSEETSIYPRAVKSLASYDVVLAFEHVYSWIKSSSLTIQMKAEKQYCRMLLLFSLSQKCYSKLRTSSAIFEK